MPVYEYECQKCGKYIRDFHSIAEHSKVLKDKCCGDLHQVIISAPLVSTPTSRQSATYHGKEARVPLNIIDEKPDGTYRVTRIGKKSDIEND